MNQRGSAWRPAARPYAFARALFAKWAATGVVRDLDVDVDLMTQIFWEGIHGFTARHLVMGLDDTWMPEVPNEAHRDLMIEVLLTGLAAARAALIVRPRQVWSGPAPEQGPGLGQSPAHPRASCRAWNVVAGRLA